MTVSKTQSPEEYARLMKHIEDYNQIVGRQEFTTALMQQYKDGMSRELPIGL